MLRTNGFKGQNRQSRRLLITVGTIIALAIFGLFVINVDPASADRGGDVSKLTANGDQGTSLVPDSDVTGAMVKMVSALVVVIALVYVGLHLLKKTMGKKYAGTTSDVLEVLQTAYVGQHKAISLVRVADRSVLVGVTDNQISPITELTAEETAKITAEAGSVPVKVAPSDSFARLLGRASDKLKEMAVRKKQTALES